MIYRWTWDNVRTPDNKRKYAIDGCTRWYPGKHFVQPWDFDVGVDPGRPGFIEKHHDALAEDIYAMGERAHNIMI
eukprot:15613088-Heterocapsa_arctica.AAC.1